MTETPVVTVFLRNGGDVLLLRRSDAVGSYPGKWGGVAGHVADDEGRDRSPEAAARAEIAEETELDSGDVTLVRAGDPFPVDDPERDDRWLVHPFLFECGSRAVEPNEETTEYEWVPPTAILRRKTVPALWTSYDRVRPRVATVREDSEHGSAWLSIRALEVLRDEAALAATARSPGKHERREANGDDWNGVAELARRLRDARPSMAVVANRVNRAMAAASEGETRSPAAVEAAASEGIDRALSGDDAAAANAAERLPDRVATLSRSGTVLAAIREAEPDAVLVAESRPGREGVVVAEALAADCEVTLTTDAAFPFELDAWDADALVVGADRVLPDGRVVNKVGTRAAALAAPDDCPCYVVAASDKVATDETVDLEERDATEVYDGDATVRVANPTFDVTPAGAVDAVITEDRVLDAEDVARVVEEHQVRADWD
ncbi:Translation initiation factor 2B subunit, eIF-2B alpha/beta/delta family [Halomicrobium zhouii]|uniref:Translation initiation factor 2B subunit, eIF-2B alpha/beta/delta family n=1 Tax=Halomicrobium zhouii TaxID=767519 RepID=A0A1I6MBW5_9EURY|nr:NUDIX domain-containing protein [Halomicrobium zhouii]SFS13083.1 Translation initiation factor 2B subunit, eIF-2B alpha/beta/delta family [Halomicrobium zhouii]